MDDLDLNLDNYDLEDIMNLFHLDYHFNGEGLQAAYKIALKTHPDKSGLPSKFFIFFMKAYKMLSKIYHFRCKKAETNIEYSADVDDGKAQLLHKLNGKSVAEFNDWFNKMFEKTKIGDDNVDSGYEDWYRSDQDISDDKVALNDFESEFDKLKRRCKALTVQNEIRGVKGAENSGYSLSREKPKEYSSGLFSKLCYEDLKKAHTETVVPVTMDDFNNKRRFRDIGDLKQHRNGQNTEPMSLHQSRKYLREHQKNLDAADTRRVYGILRRDEEIERSNKLWWANLQRLTDEQ